MFEAKLQRGSILKNVMEIAKDSVVGLNFDCTPAGLSFQAMDPSHVSLVCFMLRSEGFEKYCCDRAISLGVNPFEIHKVVKFCGNDDTLTLKADDNGDTYMIMFGDKEGSRVSDFEFKLMDIDDECLIIPEIEYSAVIRMPSSEFSHIVHNLSTIDDDVTIDVTKEGVKFSVTNDGGSGNVMLRHGVYVNGSKDDSGDMLVDVQLQEPVKIMVSLHYLKFFTKAVDLASTVVLSIKSDMPLVVEFGIEGAGYIRFYLAPKIPAEEE